MLLVVHALKTILSPRYRRHLILHTGGNFLGTRSGGETPGQLLRHIFSVVEIQKYRGTEIQRNRGTADIEKQVVKLLNHY